MKIKLFGGGTCLSREKTDTTPKNEKTVDSKHFNECFHIYVDNLFNILKSGSKLSSEDNRAAITYSISWLKYYTYKIFNQD